MNKIIAVAFILLCSTSRAQMVNGNTDVSGAHIMQVDSITQITTPTEGLLVVSRQDHQLHYYNNSTWNVVLLTQGLVYDALLSQTGTGAPTIYRRDLNYPGVTFTWARSATGVYTCTASSPVFSTTKTTVTFSDPTTANPLMKLTYTVTSTTVITINTGLQSVISLVLSIVGQDALLANTRVTICTFN